MKEEGVLLLIANDLRTLVSLSVSLAIGNVHDIQKDSEHLADGVRRFKYCSLLVTKFAIKILVSLLLSLDRLDFGEASFHGIANYLVALVFFSLCRRHCARHFHLSQKNF